MLYVLTKAQRAMSIALPDGPCVLVYMLQRSEESIVVSGESIVQCPVNKEPRTKS
jgi:hypothetical protein